MRAPVATFTDYFWDWPVQWWYLVAGGLALLLLLVAMRKPRTLVLASSDKGRLQISRHALNRLLEACCEQLKGVAKARATVARRGGKFHTELRLKIRPNAKLDAIQGYLTQEIAAIYRDNLGLDNVGAIHIEVVGVVPADEFGAS
jgi:hypothetical protein